MKNLHLIPTNKPSRLFLNKVNNKLLLDSDTYCDLIKRLPSSNYQHIYITNSEDINNNDYIITKDGRLVQVSYLLSKDLEGASKVILTTDQDLIKNGVQSIDDEFLEWFVKNPSCEEVEVKKHIGLADYSKSIDNYKYKIIIPQEELNLNCFDCNKSLQDCTCIEDTINMKQETLEEAAHNWVRQPIIGTKRESFIAGAKWQQEQDKNKYSEEDMIEFGKYLLQLSNSAMSRKFNMKMLDSETGIKLTKDLFEQFKKK
jgi:hypothetical protein